MAKAARAGRRPGQETAARAAWRGFWRRKAHHVRLIVRAVLAGFAQNNLLTYASAIALRLLIAIVPFVLFLLAIAGVLHLEGIWNDHLGPSVAGRLPAGAFHAIDQVVQLVMHRQRLFWATLGGALGLWEISGAVRAVMGALCRIYGARAERGFWARMAVSIVLAIGMAALFLAAFAVVVLVPLAAGLPGGVLGVALMVVRWAVALGLLLGAVAVMVRFAPGTPQPLRWVSFGSSLTVVGWAVMSALFGVYLTWVAHYGSVFGSLATVVVLMEYVYLSAITFLGGIQVDALFREQMTGDAAGEHGGGRLSRSINPQPK